MVETSFIFTSTDSKRVERIVDDDHVNINHMILPDGEALPEHISNSHVYMIITRGILSLQLNEEDAHDYPSGHIVNIPFQTRMNVFNRNSDPVEFFIIKAPCPKNMKM